MKLIKLKHILFSIILSSNVVCYGQNNIPDDHQNELGISNAPVYFLKEKVFAFGLHLHAVRFIKNSKFGIGLGYEHIFDEHKHTTIGFVAAFRPLKRLTLNLAPGITFEGDHKDELNFAVHAEAAYEFEIGNFHLGPAAEIAYDPEDIHLSLGLHIGFGF
jgi:hypothetical protein